MGTMNLAGQTPPSRTDELRQRVEQARRQARDLAAHRRERVEELNKRGELAQSLLRRLAKG